MTRTSASFRTTAWLALLAAALMALAPTISRGLVAAGAKTVPVLMEMCTTAGVELVDVSGFIAAAGDERVPAPAHHGMDACGHCTLATPLLLTGLLLALLPVVLPRLPGWVLRSACPRIPRNLRGLGSQAPPIVL